MLGLSLLILTLIPTLTPCQYKVTKTFAKGIIIIHKGAKIARLLDFSKRFFCIRNIKIIWAILLRGADSLC